MKIASNETVDSIKREKSTEYLFSKEEPQVKVEDVIYHLPNIKN